MTLSDQETRETEEKTPSAEEPNPFESAASEAPVGIVREFIDFLKFNKKWWLLPIILVLLLVALLVILGGTGAAPFIYTLF